MKITLIFSVEPEERKNQQYHTIVVHFSIVSMIEFPTKMLSNATIVNVSITTTTWIHHLIDSCKTWWKSIRGIFHYRSVLLIPSCIKIRYIFIQMLMLMQYSFIDANNANLLFIWLSVFIKWELIKIIIYWYLIVLIGALYYIYYFIVIAFLTVFW